MKELRSASDDAVAKFPRHRRDVLGVQRAGAAATGDAGRLALVRLRRRRVRRRPEEHRALRHALRHCADVQRGQRQGNQHGRAQGGRRAGGDRRAARAQARVVGARFRQNRAAVSVARSDRAVPRPQQGCGDLPGQLYGDPHGRRRRQSPVRSAAAKSNRTSWRSSCAASASSASRPARPFLRRDRARTGACTSCARASVKITREEDGTQYPIGDGAPGRAVRRSRCAESDASNRRRSSLKRKWCCWSSRPTRVRFIIERKPQVKEFLEEPDPGRRARARAPEAAGGTPRPAALLDLSSAVGARRESAAALRAGRAGRGSGLRRRVPGDDLQALRHSR